jgi:hypothetical protein
MKVKTHFLFFSIFVFLNACNITKTPPQQAPPTPSEPTAVDHSIFDNDSTKTVVYGCHNGSDVVVQGIILSHGKPPSRYSIQVETGARTNPRVIAKDLSFNPDGRFRFEGALPKGVTIAETDFLYITYYDDSDRSVTSMSLDNLDCKDSLIYKAYFGL